MLVAKANLIKIFIQTQYVGFIKLYEWEGLEWAWTISEMCLVLQTGYNARIKFLIKEIEKINSLCFQYILLFVKT